MRPRLALQLMRGRQPAAYTLGKEESLPESRLSSSFKLALLYVTSIMGLGAPIMWSVDPHGGLNIIAGLGIAAFLYLFPTWFYFALPRHWGLSVLAINSLGFWAYIVHQPVPIRFLIGFVLWSILELPVYGLQLLGLLHADGATITQPLRPKMPLVLLLWLSAMAVAYAIAYQYVDATPMTQYPRIIWILAAAYVPIPPAIAAWHVIRSGLLQRVAAKRTHAAG